MTEEKTGWQENPSMKEKMAAALSHDDGFLRLVARGKAELAEQLIRTARAHGIPVIRNASMNQQLEYLPVGEKIPEEVFFALAQLLEYIYAADEQENEFRV